MHASIVLWLCEGDYMQPKIIFGTKPGMEHNQTRGFIAVRKVYSIDLFK